MARRLAAGLGDQSHRRGEGAEACRLVTWSCTLRTARPGF
jgi:hypothetical protein